MKAIKVIQQASSWKDLNKTLKKLILKNQTRYAGEIFEYLVKYYLQVAPQYKTKLKYAYLLKEVPNNAPSKVTNALFVGSTAELQKMLKDKSDV